MKNLISAVILINLAAGVFWFAWTEIMQKRNLPQVKVSVPVAQALPSPREDQVTKHLENTRLSELTGYLEVIKASRLGSNDLSDSVYFYTVHTSAGPIRFQPIVQIEENLHVLHGAMVHLRENESGYKLLNKSDERRFVFELIKSPVAEPTDPAVIRVLVTPNLNGLKTRDVLRSAAAAKRPFNKVVIGPECLSPTGTQIFALLDKTLDGLNFESKSTLVDFVVVATEGCLEAEYTSLGFMPYVTTMGLKHLQVRFRLWDGKLKVDNPQVLQTPTAEELRPLKLDKLVEGAGCGDVKVSAKLEPTKVDQKIIFRAHQVGDQLIHTCQTATDILGSATCTITGLNPSLPYLISAQGGEHFDFQIWSTASCLDPGRPSISFVRKARQEVRTNCDDMMPVTLRTENVASGSQILITAEDELGHQETCLATVNEYDGIGLAKCMIPRALDGANYTLLAMYDSSRAWSFAKMQNKPKSCQ